MSSPDPASLALLAEPRRAMLAATWGPTVARWRSVDGVADLLPTWAETSGLPLEDVVELAPALLEAGLVLEDGLLPQAVAGFLSRLANAAAPVPNLELRRALADAKAQIEALKARLPQAAATH